MAALFIHQRKLPVICSNDSKYRDTKNPDGTNPMFSRAATSESFGVGFRIDHATNSRSHLGEKGKDITESLQRLRFEISQCGFALKKKKKKKKNTLSKYGLAESVYFFGKTCMRKTSPYGLNKQAYNTAIFRPILHSFKFAFPFKNTIYFINNIQDLIDSS